jgi:chromosome partitioning protein
MQTIAIISQKGGAGKTTLALALAGRSDNCLVIDADPQATASQWSEWREGNPPEVIDSAPTRIAAKVEAARSAGAELVVIDTPPHSSVAATEAAKAADIVLVPCRPSIFDLGAIRATLSLAALVQVPAFVVLTGVRVNATRHNAEARDYIAAEGGSICPHMVGERAAFRHAAAEGKTVFEFEPDGKAAQEINQLYRWVGSVPAYQPNQEAA